LTWFIIRVKPWDNSKSSQESHVQEDYFEEFEKKRDVLPIDIEAHRLAAQSFLRTDQISAAIPHLTRLVSIDKYNRLYRRDLARAYMENGSYPKAMTLLEELAGEKEDDTLAESINALLGLALFYDGKTLESIEILDNAIWQYPNSAEAVCFRGQIESAVNSGTDSAVGYFKKALTLKPDYTEASYQWARFLMGKPDRKTADLDSARMRLMSILKLEPLNARAHARLGMVYYYLNQWSLAEKTYQTALMLNPGDYNTQYNLGELYYTTYWNSSDISQDKKNELRLKALEKFKKTIEINDSHVDANFKIGLISLENDMLNDAILHFKKALKLDHENLRVLFQLGVTYEKQQRTKEALELYNSILDIDPINQAARQKVSLLSGYN
jgi:tetratricopeptide (TPR) repeat protein